MKNTIPILTVFVLLLSFSSFKEKKKDTYSLTVVVDNLRNEKGLVQFALYNKDSSIPDENFEKYFQMLKGEIVKGTATVTFKNIPEGTYAINILHDENKNGKIDKGLILPKEGVGFSNYNSIGLTNRPNFTKASFELKQDKTINVKVIYL